MYNAFIKIFYFTISSFLTNQKDNNLKDLNEFNKLMLKLANDVTEKNYIELIIFLQKNKYDVNNALIDKIINEEGDKKKASELLRWIMIIQLILILLDM